MRLILEADESWSLMMLIVSQVLDGVALSEKGSAAVRKWRSERADGSEKMLALTEEMNATLGTVIDDQTRKLIRRKGRYVSTAEQS